MAPKLVCRTRRRRAETTWYRQHQQKTSQAALYKKLIPGLRRGSGPPVSVRDYSPFRVVEAPADRSVQGSHVRGAQIFPRGGVKISCSQGSPSGWNMKGPQYDYLTHLLDFWVTNRAFSLSEFDCYCLSSESQTMKHYTFDNTSRCSANEPTIY